MLWRHSNKHFQERQRPTCLDQFRFLSCLASVYSFVPLSLVFISNNERKGTSDFAVHAWAFQRSTPHLRVNKKEEDTDQQEPHTQEWQQSSEGRPRTCLPTHHVEEVSPPQNARDQHDQTQKREIHHVQRSRTCQQVEASPNSLTPSTHKTEMNNPHPHTMPQCPQVKHGEKEKHLATCQPQPAHGQEETCPGKLGLPFTKSGQRDLASFLEIPPSLATTSLTTQQEHHTQTPEGNAQQ